MTTKYAGYSIRSDWKEPRNKAYRYRPLKKGRSTFGEFREYPGGMSVYFAARLDDERVYTKQGAWALDRALDFFLHIFKPDFIGIAISRDRKTRSIAPRKVATYYVMRLEDYFKHRREERWDWSGHVGAKGKRGSLQWLIDPMFMHEKSLLSDDEVIELKLKVPTK